MKDVKVVNVQDERVKSVQFGCITARRLITKSREGSEELMLGVSTQPAGCEATWTSKHDEVLYVLSGKKTLYCDGKRTDIKEGDAVYLPAGRRYRVVVNAKPAVTVYVTKPVE